MSTMASLRCLIAAAVLVAMATAQNDAYDAEFCRKYLDRVDDSSKDGIVPAFYDNFYLFMEIKDIIKRSTVYVDEYYSEQAEMIYGTERGKVNQSQFWIDATTNEILIGPNTKSVCLDAPLGGSSIAVDLGATTDATGDVKLNTPEVALGWHKKYQMESKYYGEDTARGIKTVKWTVCSYNPEAQVTAVTDWYIVDPFKMMLPIVPVVQKSEQEKPILPVYAYSRGINKTNPLNVTEFAISVDFTFYDSIQSNSPVFQIPTTMLCQTKPSAQVPLPQPPTFFRFKGEQITIYDPTSQNPTPPDLVYTVEQYIHELNIFVQDYITRPSSSDTTNDKSYQRTVNDYTSGISYNLDLETGGCYTTDIPGGIDSISVANGNVKMRNSQQFFDLDSKLYQYMGVHKMRGIDCDTWSAYFNGSQQDHEANALYTWYFANSQWLENTGYVNTSQPLPISLEVQKDDSYVQFNFYEFDTQDGVITPDLTLCFNENTTMNIQLNISASYCQITAVTLEAFRRAFYQALLTQTSLTSVLRISRINLQPITDNQTLLQFRLFDTSHMPVTGDVVNAILGVPNLQVLCDLDNAINLATFSIEVIDTDDSTSTLFTVQPYSLEIFGNNNLTCPMLTTPSSSTMGYSGGAMAGIAFGMLILGIILSVGALFAFYRFRKPGIASGVDKKKLDEESET